MPDFNIAKLGDLLNLVVLNLDLTSLQLTQNVLVQLTLLLKLHVLSLQRELGLLLTLEHVLEHVKIWELLDEPLLGG